MNWKQTNTGRAKPGNSGVSFFEDGRESNNQCGGGKKRHEKKCWDCGKRGHMSRDCPDRTDLEAEGEANTQVADEPDDALQMLLDAVEDAEFDCTTVQFCHVHDETTLNVNGKVIPLRWLLLDNQLTVMPSCSRTWLQKVKGSLSINTQVGTITTQGRGFLHGCGWVWHCPDGIANIPSLAKVKNSHRVTFDSADGNEFRVHKEDGAMRRFKQSKSGIC